MHDIDVLIVGDGLAGTLLAIELEKFNLSYIISSSTVKSKSTEIAAGIYNPVSFSILKKDWLVDDLIALLAPTYQYLEQLTGGSFFHNMPLMKFFDHKIDESKIEFLNPYLSEVIAENKIEGLKNTEDSLTFSSTGYVDTKAFLKSMERYFIKTNRLVKEEVRYDELIVDDNQILWKNIKARQLVFCEGRFAINNPWFPQPALALTKGEMMVIEAPGLKLDCIVKNTVFILPMGGNRFKVGSTYDRETIDELTSSEGQQWLIRHLDDMIDVPYTVVETMAGIRPTVRDRKPIIGFHPINKNIGFFSGLGSKGILQAPYCAKIMAHHINNRSIDLPREIDIKRFYKKLGFKY
jgi:hypothetical protein